MTLDPDDLRDLDIFAPLGFWQRAAYLLGPVVLTGAIVGLLYLLTALRTFNEILIAGGATLFFAGTTVVFGKAAIGEELIQLNLGTWQLALIVMYVNAASTFWYTYNLDLLQKLPGVGPYMRRSRTNAVATMRHRPWIRRWAVVGVALFVITPLPGSGALGGALVGRIIGISKRATFVSVSVAGVIVASAYALLARQVEQVLNRLEQFTPPWMRLVVFALFAFLMIWVVAKLVRWFASHPPEATDAPGDAASDTGA